MTQSLGAPERYAPCCSTWKSAGPTRAGALCLRRPNPEGGGVQPCVALCSSDIDYGVCSDHGATEPGDRSGLRMRPRTTPSRPPLPSRPLRRPACRSRRAARRRCCRRASSPRPPRWRRSPNLAPRSSRVHPPSSRGPRRWPDPPASRGPARRRRSRPRATRSPTRDLPNLGARRLAGALVEA